MIPKKLTREDVQFEIRVEPDETCSEADIRGSFATGDDDADREQADDIIRRLRAGDETAWCGVIVEARYGDHIGGDSMWGNVLSDDYTAETVAEHHGMFDNALAALQRDIDKAALNAAGEAVLAELGNVPEAKLRYWISRGYTSVSKLARLEIKRRKLAARVAR